MTRELSANTTLSHYRILSKIGAGGMGEVYLAQDMRLDRKVALKILPADLAANQDRMRRFVQEAKAAAALNHPNIATIHEIGESDGVNFIAMEFIDGVTLREKNHQERTELRKLLRYLQHAAEGLAKAHAAGIVHRDLKPDNIMITRDGHAKILDFGLAKLVEASGSVLEQSEGDEAPTAVMQQHSVPGMIMGTVGYMSPEQAQARPVDQRSDIFSFGCLLYEAATGRKPFAGDSIVDTLHKIIHDPAPAITDFNPSASPELQRVIRKCLAKEPEKRYQTIRDTANDLEELLEEMKGASDIERSVAPSTSTTASSAPGSTNDDLQPALSTASATHPAVSSAEFIYSGVKQHKFAAAVVVLVLIVGVAVGLGLYLRSGKTADAIGSIAVMPFVNESGNAELEYLSDGMTETLINSLSQLPNLSVKARSTVFHYKKSGATPQQVGSELSVQAVLNGRVTQHGDQLTLSLELVDARTGDQIWGDQYIRKATDLVALQNQVARDVANSLRTKLSTVNQQMLTKKYTENPEAYRLYLQGIFYWNQLNGPKAVEYFQQAIAIDPNYALAYSGLGDAYLLRVVITGAPTAANADEALSKARQSAAKALELDRDLPDAHGLMGLLLLTQDRDFAGFEREIKRAIELNPNYSEGHRRNGLRLFYLGQFDGALTEYRKALDLDPLSNLNNYNYAQTFVYAGSYDEAETQIRKNLKMDPGFALFHVQLSILYRLKGNYAAAVEESAKTSEQQDHPESARLRREGFAKGGWPGYLRALVTELEQSKSNPYALATAYVELGEKDKAFAALEDVYNSHSNFVGYFKIDPQLNPLRDDPRFQALLKKSGFPQ